MNFGRVLKISIGCALSILIASMFSIQNYISAGLITLLSLQNTKKETIKLALQRFIALILAISISYIFFTILGFNLLAFSLYLFFFSLISIYYNLTQSIPMCTVLVTHFWIRGDISMPFILNEVCLFITGAGVGIILNLFIRRNIAEIKNSQAKIEDLMRKIISQISDVILGKGNVLEIHENMAKLKKLLSKAKERAHDASNNTLLSDLNYYINYLDMRKSQYIVLDRILDALEKFTHLSFIPSTSESLSQFLKNISSSFHEYNNAVSLIEELNTLKSQIKESPLPQSREEFEARALLFSVFNYTEHLLIIKKNFADSLSPDEKRTFWSDKYCNLPTQTNF